MKTPVIAANWKMHKTIEEGIAFMQELCDQELSNEREYIIATPDTMLAPVAQVAENTGYISVAAQNMYFETSGAFTGELSPLHVQDAGAQYVLIGHSERRHVFGETDELLNKKMLTAEAHGITPIFCVGENESERNGGNAEAVVLQQLTKGLAGLTPEFLEQVIVAYEPVWAIGTGNTATVEQAEEMHAFIAQHVPVETRILYGGSVKPANATELLQQEHIDGVLVGGASLEIESFTEICRA